MLESQRIHKRFPGVEALKDVSISLFPGEVVGLVGENGSGKSTLLSVMSGAQSPDAGEIRVKGETVRFPNYLAANHHGLFRIHQDRGLVPNMTVADNIFLGHERLFRSGPFLRRAKMVKEAEKHLGALEGRVSATDLVSELSLDLRVMVEVMRAVALADVLETGPPVLMLDETTASLNLDEVEDLYRFIESHRGTSSIVFVSHRLREVLEVSDWIYVLKDGALVKDLDPRATDEEMLHAHMVGRTREDLYYREDLRVEPSDRAALELRGVSSAPYFADVSLTVNAGEIVCVGGVSGSGKTELARAIAGDLATTEGEIAVSGEMLTATSPRERVGRVGYGPLDRHREGVSLHQSISLNITLSSLPDICAAPQILSKRAERRAARWAMDEYGIVAPNETTNVVNLSGGNQQKVMLARLVAARCDVLVLDNPTRGVDVGARQEIYYHLRRLVQQGLGILMVSDDLHELIGMGDRVAIMRDGRVSHVFHDVHVGGVTEEQVVGRMV